MTRKTRFIRRLHSVTHNEKEDIIAFFSKYPLYESYIDWNKKSLTYKDFETVFELAGNSRKNRRKKIKTNPEEFFKNYNCRIAGKTDEFIILMPLDWACAVFLNSFECGETGAVWCIGRKHTYRFWNNYIKDGDLFYFAFFLKKDVVWGKKIMIQYSRKNDSFYTWLQNNKCVRGISFLYEDMCRNDLASFTDGMTHPLKKEKLTLKILLIKIKPLNTTFVYFIICLLASVLIRMIPGMPETALLLILFTEYSLFNVLFLTPFSNTRKKKKHGVMKPVKNKKGTGKEKRTLIINKKEARKILETVNKSGEYAFTLNKDDNYKTLAVKNYRSDCENPVIPDSVNDMPITVISDSAFQFKKRLKSVTLPGGITSIKNHAFCYCDKLKNIRLPKKTAKIGSWVFSGCDNLERIDVDEENENFTSHEGVLFNKEMTAILWCPQKTSGNYIIPETVITIKEDDAFSQCGKLTGLILPKNILLPEFITFNGCEKLNKFYVDDNNMMYKSIDGVLFTKNEKELLMYPQGNENKEYIIPRKTISINKFAFENCKHLENIIFPENLERIGCGAFFYCENITSLTFAENLKYIDRDAFYKCRNLKIIKLSKKTKTDKQTFNGYKGKIIYYDR